MSKIQKNTLFITSGEKDNSTPINGLVSDTDVSQIHQLTYTRSLPPSKKVISPKINLSPPTSPKALLALKPLKLRGLMPSSPQKKLLSPVNKPKVGIEYPYSAIVHLTSEAVNGIKLDGIGCMVGPRHVLTILDEFQNLESILAIPGRFNSENPFGIHKVQDYIVLKPGGSKKGQPSLALILLILGKDVGEYSGWFGSMSLEDDDLVEDTSNSEIAERINSEKTPFLTSYEAGKQVGLQDMTDMHVMKTQKAKVLERKNLKETLRSDETIVYSLKNNLAKTGSPLWIRQGNSFYIVGLHLRNTNVDNVSIGIRMNEKRVVFIKSFLEKSEEKQDKSISFQKMPSEIVAVDKNLKIKADFSKLNVNKMAIWVEQAKTSAAGEIEVDLRGNEIDKFNLFLLSLNLKNMSVKISLYGVINEESVTSLTQIGTKYNFSYFSLLIKANAIEKFWLNTLISNLRFFNQVDELSINLKQINNQNFELEVVEALLKEKAISSFNFSFGVSSPLDSKSSIGFMNSLARVKNLSLDLSEISSHNIDVVITNVFAKLSTLHEVENLRFNISKTRTNDFMLKTLADSLVSLRKLTSLSLNFSGCYFISDNGISDVTNAFSNLSKLQSLCLDLSECTLISDESVRNILVSLVSLEEISGLDLNLSKCSMLSDQTLQDLAEYFKEKPKKFVSICLSLAECHFISDDGVKVLSSKLEHIVNLRTLSINFDECNQLTDISFIELAASVTHLTNLKSLYLNFRKCGAMSNIGVGYISKALIKLQKLDQLHLNLEDCFWINEKGFKSLTTALKPHKNIRYLTLKFNRALYMKNKWVEELLILLKGYTNLIEVDLSFMNCLVMQDKRIEEMWKNLSELKSLEKANLNFEGAFFQDYGGLEELSHSISNFENLVNLNLFIQNSSLNNGSLKFLGEALGNLSYLKYLNLNLSSKKSHPGFVSNFTSSQPKISPWKDDDVISLSGALSRLKNIENLEIDLENCQILSNEGFLSIVDAIKEHTNLYSFGLNIANNKFVSQSSFSKLFRVIQKLKNLSKLALNFENCAKFNDEALGNLLLCLKKLITICSFDLNLAGCSKITQSRFDEFFGFEKIYHIETMSLNFSRCALHNKVLDLTEPFLTEYKMKQLSLLFENCLSFDESKLEDLAYRFKKFSNLRHLDFSFKGSRVSKEMINIFIKSLSSCYQLETLKLDLTGLSTLENQSLYLISEVLKVMISLRSFELRISDCVTIDDKGLRLLSTSLSMLKHLTDLQISFRNISNISESGFSELASQISSMKLIDTLSLEFQACNNLKPRGIKILGSCLRHLVNLRRFKINLQECSFTDGVLSEFCYSLKGVFKLSELEINFAETNAGNKTLYSLVILLKNAFMLSNISLNLSGCKEISQEDYQNLVDAIEDAKTSFPNRCYLNFENTNISDSGVSEI